MDQGRTTLADKRGNDDADALAVLGAASHEVDQGVVHEAKLRRLAAERVHRMFLAVLAGRRVQAQQLAGNLDAGEDATEACVQEHALCNGLPSEPG